MENSLEYPFIKKKIQFKKYCFFLKALITFLAYLVFSNVRKMNSSKDINKMLKNEKINNINTKTQLTRIQEHS